MRLVCPNLRGRAPVGDLPRGVMQNCLRTAFIRSVLPCHSRRPVVQCMHSRSNGIDVLRKDLVSVVNVLQESLQHERVHGCSNTAGQSGFSFSYAADTFITALDVPDLPQGLKHSIQQLHTDIRQYPGLSISQRHAIVNHLIQLLEQDVRPWLSTEPSAFVQQGSGRAQGQRSPLIAAAGGMHAGGAAAAATLNPLINQTGLGPGSGPPHRLAAAAAAGQLPPNGAAAPAPRPHYPAQQQQQPYGPYIPTSQGSAWSPGSAPPAGSVPVRGQSPRPQTPQLRRAPAIRRLVGPTPRPAAPPPAARPSEAHAAAPSPAGVAPSASGWVREGEGAAAAAGGGAGAPDRRAAAHWPKVGPPGPARGRYQQAAPRYQPTWQHQHQQQQQQTRSVPPQGVQQTQPLQQPQQQEQKARKQWAPAAPHHHGTRVAVHPTPGTPALPSQPRTPEAAKPSSSRRKKDPLPAPWRLYFPDPLAAPTAAAAPAPAPAVPPAGVVAAGDGIGATVMSQQQQQQHLEEAGLHSEHPIFEVGEPGMAGTESLEPLEHGSTQQEQQQQHEVQQGPIQGSELHGEGMIGTATEEAEQAAGRAGHAAWDLFVQCALGPQQDQVSRDNLEGLDVNQRSKAWLKLREGRLTASALCNLLGWFDWSGSANSIRELWEEKLGLRDPTPTKPAMLYGTALEPLALEVYRQRRPQAEVQQQGFAVWGSHAAHSWLGASPDGLIVEQATSSSSSSSTFPSIDTQPGSSSSSGGGVSDDGNGRAEGSGLFSLRGSKPMADGLLEIKVPFKARPGNPDVSKRELQFNEYYMPQVQMLLEILNLPWADLYYFSEGMGDKVVRLTRDKDYFALLWQVAADFWWQHLVPAKAELARHGLTREHLLQHPESRRQAAGLVGKYRPVQKHPYFPEIQRRSKQMLEEALAKRDAWKVWSATEGEQAVAHALQQHPEMVQTAKAGAADAAAWAASMAAAEPRPASYGLRRAVVPRGAAAAAHGAAGGASGLGSAGGDSTKGGSLGGGASQQQQQQQQQGQPEAGDPLAVAQLTPQLQELMVRVIAGGREPDEDPSGNASDG